MTSGYSLTVRESIMIAHSFKSEVFGPARNMHGATYTVDATFSAPDVDKNNIVMDIGLALDILKKVCAKYNYKNLDELEEFQGQETTTERMARAVHENIASEVKGQFKGKLKVTLTEKHNAWASYKAPVN